MRSPDARRHSIPNRKTRGDDHDRTARSAIDGRSAARQAARQGRQGPAREGRRQVHLFVLDRPARHSEDQAGADRRFRAAVCRQGAAVRRAFGVVRAGTVGGGFRPDPDPRSRHAGDLPVGQEQRLDVRRPVVGG